MQMAGPSLVQLELRAIFFDFSELISHYSEPSLVELELDAISSSIIESGELTLIVHFHK